MQQLDDLAALSRRYGADPDYVFLGGGNTSFKTPETLYIKPSGVALATIQADQFLRLHGRADLHADRVLHAAEEFHMRAVRLPRAVADPQEVGGTGIGIAGRGIDARQRLFSATSRTRRSGRHDQSARAVTSSLRTTFNAPKIRAASPGRGSHGAAPSPPDISTICSYTSRPPGLSDPAIFSASGPRTSTHAYVITTRSHCAVP